MFNIFSRALRVTLLVIKICICPEVVLRAVFKSPVSFLNNKQDLLMIVWKNKTMSWLEDLSVFVSRHIGVMTAGTAQTRHILRTVALGFGHRLAQTEISIQWHFMQTFIVSRGCI